MAENKNYMPLCTLMPSELQLPFLQYCSRLLPSRTLRLRVHVCGCLYSQFYTFSVLSVLPKRFWLEIPSMLTVPIHRGTIFWTLKVIYWERHRRLNMKGCISILISDSMCNAMFPLETLFPRNLSRLSLHTMVALWIGSVACKCDFHACFVHVDCCFVIFIHWCISSASIHELLKSLIMVRQLHLTWLILPV